MSKYVFIVAITTAFWWSCKSETPADAAVLANPGEAPAVNLDSVVFALICKDITQAGDKVKHHDVYAVVGHDTVRVGTIESCQKIAPADYEKYEIPANAYEAVGGTGADNITYAVYLGKSPEGKINARIGHNYPGKKSGSFDYRSMIVFNEEDIAPASVINPAAMTGSYLHKGGASSYVLYLGYNNRTLIGQLYTIKGALPEQKDSLMTAISNATPEIMADIQVDWSNLSFSSAKGPGTFKRNGNRIESITFSKLASGGSLTLEKKEIGE
ncbi:MAG: hypothetical protein IPG32_11730 [Saprospirales bacterium]|nr:hypothetical protein [Saprospirales bacterium]